MPKYVASTTPAGPDAERTRFRRPLGVAVMAYKAVLGYLLAATVALLLPVDLRQAVLSPTPAHILLATANAAALVVLVLLISPRERRTGRPRDGIVTRSRGGR